jgi:thiamine phosphate synthase YjbQ (UPF0047 family)
MNTKKDLEDLLTALTRLVPVKGEYCHRQKAHAHILSSMIKPGISVPVIEAKMKLGCGSPSS